MATQLGDLTLEEAAKEAAGNWRDFHCFVWFRDRELSDPDAWAIIYTHNRDSGLLDQSNAAVIAKTLESLTEGDDPDVFLELHSHWAVGQVDGFSIRVFRNGEITEAFKVYYDLAQCLADYPILDESDYSDREYEATLENLPLAAWRIEKRYELPEGWEGEVYSWLSDNRCWAIENKDDLGGWPDEDDLEAAFAALGYEQRD